MIQEVRIEAGSAERCAQHCDQLADSLDHEVARLQGIPNGGFGGFVSSQELTDGFTKKVHFAIDAVNAHAAAARQMAENFRTAGGAFESQDELSASDLADLSGMLSQPASPGEMA